MRTLQPGTTRMLGVSCIAAGLAMYISAVHLTPKIGDIEMYSQWGISGLVIAAVGSVFIWVGDYMMTKIRKQANIAELLRNRDIKSTGNTKHMKRGK